MTPQGGVTAGSSTQLGSAGAGAAAKPAEELPRPPEEPIKLPFDNFVATFSTYCGGALLAGEGVRISGARGSVYVAPDRFSCGLAVRRSSTVWA